MKIKRRDFLKGSAAWVVGCAAGCRTATRRSTYSVPLLGDVHYDRPPIGTFHSEFRRRHGTDGMFDAYRGEFESFSSMWSAGGGSAELVAASGKVRRADAAFALQLGDLVEGDCESSAAHARMLSDALAFMKRTYGDKPSDFGRCRVRANLPGDASVDSLYAEYEPGLKRYYTADAAGHAALVFSDDGVRADYYGLDSIAPTTSFTIRG